MRFSINALASFLALAASAVAYDTPMVVPTDSEWKPAQVVHTIGEGPINGFSPPGILDGLGAYKINQSTVRILANTELPANQGYPYSQDDTVIDLTGARVVYFDVDRTTLELKGSGLAHSAIYNRQGNVVTGPADLEFGGINRLCSSGFFGKAGELGLVDSVYFTGEETGGGTEFALDVVGKALHAVPWMGRAGKYCALAVSSCLRAQSSL